MSVFQIPGLGQAKPNEILPPLVSDSAAAAISSAQDDEMQDDTTAATAPANDSTTSENHISQEPRETSLPDSMAIDQPESPPSLTAALEAAIGGLGGEQPNTQQEEQVPLGPDQSEHPEWEVDSSPYESSSESSSSDSSDEEDSDQEGYEPLGIEETARLLMEMEGGSDDEGERGGKASGSGYTRTKNELPEASIPKPDVTITPEMKMEELGAIENIVENIILIKAFTPGEYQVLDSGSVLCTADRVVVGAIAETIGKVLQPMYTVMFSSEEEIKELGLEVGTKLYYPVDHASFVFTEPLKSIKGSDASNLHDEEVCDEEREFSDDEKEAEYKRSLKQKKKDKWKNGQGSGRDREPHPLRQETSAAHEGLKYDEDDDDGPYKPLARPAGYGAGPVSVESYEPSRARPTFQRGRGRDSRGRGGRGGGGGGGGGGGRFSGRGGRGAGALNAPRDGYSAPPQGPQQFAPSTPLPPHTTHTNTASGAVPALTNFGFPLPGWPTPGQPLGAPPPPPPVPAGWSPHSGTGGGNGGNQVPNPGAFVNPAFFAALMSHMQSQSAGHGGWGQQPPAPPGGQ